MNRRAVIIIVSALVLVGCIFGYLYWNSLPKTVDEKETLQTKSEVIQVSKKIQASQKEIEAIDYTTKKGRDQLAVIFQKNEYQQPDDPD